MVIDVDIALRKTLFDTVIASVRRDPDATTDGFFALEMARRGASVLAQDFWGAMIKRLRFAAQVTGLQERIWTRIGDVTAIRPDERYDADDRDNGDRDEQLPERFQVGQKFDAMVIGFDRSKKPNFSIKAMQIAEEKQAVAQYGSSDSGASLGDILGAALKEASTKK